MAGQAGGRRGRGFNADPDPRVVQCQGQGGAWLGACLGELAAGLPAGRGGRADRGRSGSAGIGTLGIMTVTEAFENLRPLMFSIAYRMLGSVTDAEDIVQEAFLRHHRVVAGGSAVESPKAFLSSVTTRLSIDQLRSARSRREAYVGPWLPEPMLTDPAAPAPAAPDPAAQTEDNCRQLARRARQHVAEHKPRFEASRRERDELAARFFAAVGEGDMSGIVDLLAADVVVYGDSGGTRPSWPRPIVGRDKVG